MHGGLQGESCSGEEDVSSDGGWIPWYCGLKGHEFFAEVEEDFARDSFNLYGLRGFFHFYDEALKMILNREPPTKQDLAHTSFIEIYRDAADLYGLIHARYVVSTRGLQVMKDKYARGIFGVCPRVLCGQQRVLPIGRSAEPRTAQLRVFCPLCEQMYSPRGTYRELDGSAFGMSFPQVFLQAFPSVIPLESPRPFVPRVFGFKLHGQKTLIGRKLEEQQAAAQNSQQPVQQEGEEASAEPGTGSAEPRE